MIRCKCLSLTSFCIVLTLVMQVSVFGAVRDVYETDGAQGIQDSINASSAGDTVLVHNGSYYVKDIDSLGITMRDSIVFMSDGGAESCTLNGLNSARTDTAYHVIYCEFCDSSSRAAIIQGFTITQGNAMEVSSYSYMGGGIFCYESSPTIQNNIIVNNLAELGGGIYCSRFSSIIQNNIICNNVAESSGGGIYCYRSVLTIQDNIVNNNVADQWGGGIRCARSLSTISRNVIESNLSTSGSGITSKMEETYTKVLHSVIANNIATLEGGALHSSSSAKMYVDSCFIVNNGSIQEGTSGLAYIWGADGFASDTFGISNSNLYYNIFQPKFSIHNGTMMVLPLQNNFWGDTTTSRIDDFIYGPADFTPYKYDFISGVPGEPISIDSVRNYDSNYSIIIDSLWGDPDTLYLRIYGQDRNAKFREAAVVILKSSIYPSGIAVALIETDTNSGIYEGKAVVRVVTGTYIRDDDIWQTIRADSLGDNLQIVSNINTSKNFVVYYKKSTGVEENSKIQIADCKLFQNYPNPFTKKTKIRFQMPNLKCQASLKIYDLAGQLVKAFSIANEQSPINSIVWDGKNKNGKRVGSGVYFYKLEAGDFTKTRKMFLIK